MRKSWVSICRLYILELRINKHDRFPIEILEALTTMSLQVYIPSLTRSVGQIGPVIPTATGVLIR